MSTLKATNLQHASATSPNIVLGSDGSVAVGGGNISPQTGFRNRIINGSMVIDQRNAGASVTPTASAQRFPVDRFVVTVSQDSKLTAQQSTTAPTGFSNSLLVTSSSAYSVLSSDVFVIRQSIEGFNFADFGFGTASAATVTLSFLVRSSLTGNFGGALTNYAATRSYPFSYTINAANTWEYKTVTISGDTTGTWVGASSSGAASLWFGLGVGSTSSNTAGAWAAGDYRSVTGATSVVGTNGATFYITGVQLEKGSSATAFEFRSIGQELALCQRYYAKTFAQSVAPAQNAGRAGTLKAYAWTLDPNSLGLGATWKFPVEMRAAPTITTFNPNNTNGSWRNNANTGDASATATETSTGSTLVYISATLGATDAFVIHATASVEL